MQKTSPMKHEKQPVPTIAAALRIGKITNILIITISLLSLFGWATGVRLLTSWGHAYKPMATSSTFLFLAFGALLLLNTLKPQWKPIRALLALAALATIGHSLWVFSSTGSLRSIMDLIITKKSLTYLNEYAGYMSPLTAGGWLVASLSLIQCIFSFNRRLARIIADILAIVLFFFGLTCTIGYLYGMPFLYGSAINPPALPTSLMFMLLAVSLLMHHSNKSVFPGLFLGQSIHSRLLRIFLPAMMLLMTATGWFFSRFPLNVSGMNPAIMGSLSTTGVLLFTGILIALMSHMVGRDIDAAQEKVCESERMLRHSQQVAILGHYSLSIATGFWTSSEMLDEIFGISTDYKKDIEGWLNCVHPEHQEEMLAYLTIYVLRNKNRFDKEYKIIRQNDGATRWVHGSGDLEFDANGQPTKMFGVIQDISEHKRAEQNLQLNHERLEEAQSIAKIGNWEANLGTGELYWSEVIFDIFGFEPESFKPSVKTFYEAVHPDDRNSVLESEKRSEQTGLHDVVHRIIRPNGEIRFVHELARRHTDSQGNLIMLRGTVQDITERKRAEEKIFHQNKFLLDVLNSLTHPFYVIDASTYRIITANPAAHIKDWQKDITCYHLTHGMNQPCNTTHHPCPLIEVKKSKKAMVVEHIHSDNDGNARNFEIHAYPIFNNAGEVSQIIEYALDVTDRLLAEERYRSIFENAAEGIFQSTPEGHFISVNPAFAKIYGYDSPQEVIAMIKDIGEQIYVNPKHREEIISLLWKQGSVENFETQQYRKDGSIIWVSTNIHVCRKRHDNPLFFEGTSQDITERKKLEAQLLQSQKMEAVGKLAGGIAHDFSNLLTSIIGNTELLIYKRKRKDGIFQRLNTIRETANRAAQLTRQLLMLSRRQVLNPEIMNLNEVVNSMQRMLERILGEDIQCQFNPEPGLWMIKADAMSIEQVILNLIVNARQAMPHGGILKIQTANVHADEKSIPQTDKTLVSEFVMISIADTGIGIPSEVTKDIFEPFFTTKAGGTGLGLSIVHRIVKQSGGFIEVYSELGKGTDFKIYLPSLPQDDVFQKSKTAPAEEKLPTGTETILVVEDDSYILELVQTVLQDLQYSILVAHSGEEALKIIESEGKRIDLVLSDIVLPGINGGIVAEAIKNKFPKIKFLFMSGYPDERIAITEIIKSPNQFIKKPFEILALAMKIRETLDSN